MTRRLSYVADSEDDGKLIKELLRRKLKVSASLLAKMKAQEGGIRLNGKPVFVNERIKKGDIIEVIIENGENPETSVSPIEGPLDIRFENEDVLIINKPAGVAVHPTSGDHGATLANIFRFHYPDLVFRPINRLDKVTSGLMAVAKNAYTHTYAAELLHTEKFVREYVALCEGVIDKDEGEVDAPIARDGAIRRCVSESGVSAKTLFKVIKRSEKRTLIRVLPITGRTHQIRVHMAHLGHPLAGDFLYGREEAEILGRCALHSERIRLELPFGGGMCDVSCEIPEEFLKML